MPLFFKDKPLVRMLGAGIEAEHLNDDALGRALDAVYAYGPEGVIHVTQGYSRDHRPDLNPVVPQLITEHPAGVPLWMEALSGNSSDKASFRQTLNAHLEQLRGGVGLSRIVADSALYTEKTLHEWGDFPWITRVPETIGGVRELILAVSGDWLASCPKRAFVEVGADYAGIRQRWLVVYTRSAHERAEKTVNRQHLKQSQAEYQAFRALAQQSFACRADAETALARWNTASGKRSGSTGIRFPTNGASLPPNRPLVGCSSFLPAFMSC